MAIRTELYLAPLVLLTEVEHDPVDGDTTRETPQYKTTAYLRDFDGSEETFHWMESWPAYDPEWRFVLLTADEEVQQAIAADPDIVAL